MLTAKTAKLFSLIDKLRQYSLIPVSCHPAHKQKSLLYLAIHSKPNNGDYPFNLSRFGIC